MKIVEFDGIASDSGEIALPRDVANEIPPGEPLHIVISWQRSEDDAAWRSAGNEAFECAYAPEDNVYEKLLDDASIR